MNQTTRYATCALVVALGAASVGIFPSSSALAAAPGSIAGTVFNDPNQNGTKNPAEGGLGGVQVTATAADGASATTTTAADGTYEFTGLTGRHRIEFATPTGLAPSRVGTGSGITNGSTVQFADAGSDVNAAFADPSQYCQANPQMAMTCMLQTPTIGAAMKTTPYIASATDTSGTSISDLNAVGSTYGVAWNPVAKKIYQSAFFKRGIALGPDGLGAIYTADPAGGAATAFATIPNTGTNPRPATPDWTRDAESFASVYKIGLGDIDISDDFKTLYAVNLNDNGVYSVAVNADGSAGAVSGPAIPALPADCTASQFHVFGLGIKGTKGYLTGVCSGPTTADLKGYLFPFTASGTVASIDAAELSFPMNYEHGQSLAWTITSNESEDGNFLPWDGVTSELDSDVRKSANNIGAAQAQITDLEFTDSGSLVIGIRDRFGDQTGQRLLGVVLTDNVGYSSASAGDILMICGAPGSWALESNGSCGGVTGTGVGNNQGPGGGEFFAQDNFGGSRGHDEVSIGSLAVLPGSGEIVAGVYDPNSVRSQGSIRFSNAGARVAGNTLSGTDQPGTFGKANGLGDIELLCDLAPLEIGNRIWVDADGDGIQDPTDAAIDGVIVELYKDGVLVGTTTTANGGQYYFNETNVTIDGTPGIVPNIAYEIRIPNASGASQQAALAGLSLTGADATGTGNDVRDSDATAAIGSTTAVIPVPATAIAVPGANNHTFDAGFVPTYSLGNRVWMDSGAGGGTVNDGIQNGTEPGIAGVTLKLYAADASGAPTGAVLGTQVTDANGYYRFDNLAPGNYVVVVDTAASATPLAGVASSTGSAPANTNVDRDDNGSDTALPAGSVLPGGIASSVITLGLDGPEPTTESDLPVGGTADSAANQYSNQTVDFGFVPSYSLGNRVWFDTDNNGTMDAAEVGAAGVSVTLLDAAGNPVPGRTMTTDADGRYRFDGLPSGTYSVRINAANFAAGGVLADYASSTPTEAAPNDGVDRNDNGLQPATPNGALTAGIVSGPVELGPLPEPTGETDLATTPGDSPDARSNLTVDFGFHKTAVGNTLWHDTDNDGLIDAGEPRLEGVVVNLVDAVSGAIIGTATTNAQGQYQISKTTTGAPLPVGTSVKISIPSAQTPLTGLEPSDPTGTADSFNHGTTVGANVESPAFTLTPGAATGGQTVNNATATTTNPTLDFGFNSPLASLGDRVWVDADRDGQQDEGEVGVAGVTVELRDASGAVVKTATTDANGLYKFSDLQPGTYSVKFVPSTLPAGATFTSANTGADASDSDANQTTGVTGTYTLAKRQFIPTVDAGILTPLASIGDTVWSDTDRDGTQDAGEAGVPGVSVELLDATGAVVKTMVTDANGKYLFDQLTPGTYSVRFVPSSLPAGMVFTSSNTGDDAADSDADTSTGKTGSYTLAGGDNVRTVDAGIVVALASIGDTVWFDTDRDGTQDAGEAGVPGVSVELLDATGAVVKTMVTDANGKYLFDQLTPGTYSVRFVPSSLPGGSVFTSANTGDDAADSDADPSTGKTGTYTLGAGDAVRTVDAGIVTPEPVFVTPVVNSPAPTTAAPAPAIPVTPAPTVPSVTVLTPTTAPAKPVVNKVTTRIFVDLDEDGIQDPNENPLPGVEATLTAADGTVRKAVSDANGDVTFTDVPAGPATIRITGEVPPELEYLTKKTITVSVLGIGITKAEAFRLNSSASLALTGSNQTTRTASLAFAITVAGLGLLMAGRRRRQSL